MELTNFKIICTYPNSDIGGKEIIKILKRWEKAYEFIDVYESLGRKDFHGLLNLNNTSSEIRSCYLGNSSAGVKETPALKCPSIIIGNRQKEDCIQQTLYLLKKIKNKFLMQLVWSLMMMNL